MPGADQRSRNCSVKLSTTTDAFSILDIHHVLQVNVDGNSTAFSSSRCVPASDATMACGIIHSNDPGAAGLYRKTHGQAGCPQGATQVVDCGMQVARNAWPANLIIGTTNSYPGYRAGNHVREHLDHLLIKAKSRDVSARLLANSLSCFITHVHTCREAFWLQ